MMRNEIFVTQYFTISSHDALRASIYRTSDDWRNLGEETRSAKRRLTGSRTVVQRLLISTVKEKL